MSLILKTFKIEGGEKWNLISQRKCCLYLADDRWNQEKQSVLGSFGILKITSELIVLSNFLLGFICLPSGPLQSVTKKLTGSRGVYSFFNFNLLWKVIYLFFMQNVIQIPGIPDPRSQITARDSKIVNWIWTLGINPTLINGISLEILYSDVTTL